MCVQRWILCLFSMRRAYVGTLAQPGYMQRYVLRVHAALGADVLQQQACVGSRARRAACRGMISF